MGFKGFLAKSMDGLDKILNKKTSRHMKQLNTRLLNRYPFGGPRSGMTEKDLPRLREQLAAVKLKYDKKEFLVQSEQKEIWEINELVTDAYIARDAKKNSLKDFPINWEKLKWEETPEHGDGYYYICIREEINDENNNRRPTSAMVLYTKASFTDSVDNFYWAFLQEK
jgi:hypothetical protein